MSEREPSRPVTDDAQAYREQVEAIRASADRAREAGREAGLILPGPTPRRKKRYSPYCENDGCPNGLWGPAAMADGRNEHHAWLDGKRKDAAFCSNACRQKAHRRRVKGYREGWAEFLPGILAKVAAADETGLWEPFADWTPPPVSNDRAWRRVQPLIDVIVETVKAVDRGEGK